MVPGERRTVETRMLFASETEPLPVQLVVAMPVDEDDVHRKLNGESVGLTA